MNFTEPNGGGVNGMNCGHVQSVLQEVDPCYMERNEFCERNGPHVEGDEFYGIEWPRSRRLPRARRRWPRATGEFAPTRRTSKTAARGTAARLLASSSANNPPSGAQL